MRWLTNTPDPDDKDVAYWALPVALNEKRSEVWEKHLAWLADKHIGDPKTNCVSVAFMKRRGYVGVYEIEKDGEK